MQIDLFDREPAAPVPVPRRRFAARVAAFVRWVQLDLLSPSWLNRSDDEPVDDDPFVIAPVVHRTVLALDAEPPQTTGIRSVFDMAAAVLSKPPRAIQKPAEPEPPRYGRTLREVGVTRHIAMRYDETAEWAEKERARRARQKVPRPSKAIRTRSRKLLELVGGGNG